jgi:hypothetical protein
MWLRDFLVLVAGESGNQPILTELVVYSPLQALSSAAFALVIFLAFREWFSIRLDA